MYVNDMRFRDIKRLLGVHHTTVVNWIKVATPVSDTPEVAEIPEVTQLDE
jgi:transposase-like protein